MEASSSDIAASVQARLLKSDVVTGFQALALDLFRFQYSSNSPYRALCDARHIDPGSIEHWSQIPAVTTSAFKDFAFSCLSPAERAYVFYSSGTTEQRRSGHFHNQTSLRLYETSLLAWFERFAPTETATRSFATSSRGPVTILSLTPPPEAAAHSSLVHMFATIMRASGSEGSACDSTFLGTIAEDASWTLDLPLARRRLTEACSKLTPVFLFGTAFLFVHLLDSLRTDRLQFGLPPGSMVLETGGYKGRSRVIPRTELHSLICDSLGLTPQQILCEYGMCELSSQAYARVPAGGACDSPRIFQFPPWACAQVISPESGLEVSGGDRGLLRIFDLANAWSVCAIQTEDLAIRRGAGFELIGRAQTAEARGCSLMSHGRP